MDSRKIKETDPNPIETLRRLGASCHREVLCLGAACHREVL